MAPKLLSVLAALLALAVLASASSSDSSSDSDWMFSSSWEGSVLHEFQEVPIDSILTLDHLPPLGWAPGTYSACTYDPETDLAVFNVIELSVAAEDDSDYAITEQLRFLRGGCHTSRVIYIEDSYRELHLLEPRSVTNSLAFSLLTYRVLGTAFNSDGLVLLSERGCGATARIYQPALLTECAASTCGSRTLYGVIAWADSETFVLGAPSCSIGDVSLDVAYSFPFRKAQPTSVVIPTTTSSSAATVFPCIMLLAVAIILALL